MKHKTLQVHLKGFVSPAYKAGESVYTMMAAQMIIGASAT